MSFYCKIISLCFIFFSCVLHSKEKIRVLYLLRHYPKLSETYIHEEIASIWEDYEVKIYSLTKSTFHRKNHFPVLCEDDIDVEQLIEEFKPHVMHTHWITNVPLVDFLAEKYGIPYTVRSHSFDVLSSEEKLQKFCTYLKKPLCLRILCFPNFKGKFTKFAVSEEKIKECWPVVNYKAFNSSQQRPLQGKIINVGAALAKKNYESFIDLAYMMRKSGWEFALYITGKRTEKIKEYNKKKGFPVKTITYVEPEDMPKIYQSSDWLVCTGNPKFNTLGYPVSIAEAQASGIGICLQELPGRKKDFANYLGGAGFVFSSIEELPSILAEPYPEEMRLKGLENAKKCDIDKHKYLLTEVWNTLL